MGLKSAVGRLVRSKENIRKQLGNRVLAENRPGSSRLRQLRHRERIMPNPLFVVRRRRLQRFLRAVCVSPRDIVYSLSFAYTSQALEGDL